MRVKKIKQLREALRALEVNDEKGTLTAYGERFMFIPIALIHSIEDRLTADFGPATASMFQYQIGKEGGEQYIRLAEKAGFDLKKSSSLQQITRRFGTMSGWGKVDIVKYDGDRKLLTIRWINGVSVRNRKGKTPVCHFGRGVLTGAAEVIFGRECESLETSCQGKGDPYCEAIIGDPEEIGLVANGSRRPSSSRA